PGEIGFRREKGRGAGTNSYAPPAGRGHTRSPRMFGFGGLKKSSPAAERHRLVGLDLSATPVRAVAVGVGAVRTLHLAEPNDDLPLFVTLDRRPPGVGYAALGRLRIVPHTVCSNFLPLVGSPNEWRGERLTLTPETALEECLRAIRPTVAAETDAAG